MIRSLSPSAAAASSNPGWSRTLDVPWSGMITAVSESRTSGSSPRACRVATQSVGRLKVGMPTAIAARPGASRSAYQPPATSSRDEPSLVRSNHTQPPSPNGASETGTATSCSVSPASEPSGLSAPTTSPATWTATPRAVER